MPRLPSSDCLRAGHQRSALYTPDVPQGDLGTSLTAGGVPPVLDTTDSKKGSFPRRRWLAPWPCRVDPCPGRPASSGSSCYVESGAKEGTRRSGMKVSPAPGPCPAALRLDLHAACVSAPGTPPEVLGRAGRVIWGSWPLEAMVQLTADCEAWGHEVDRN